MPVAPAKKDRQRPGPLHSTTTDPHSQMASLVAQKPGDNPTSPGMMSPAQMMSIGGDPAALDDYLNLDLFSAAPSASRASNSPASSHGALPVTPGTADQASTLSPRPLFPALDASPGGPLSFLDSYTPLDKNFGAFPDLSMMPGSSMDLGMGNGLDQYNNLFQDMFAGFSEPGPSNSDALFGAAPAEPQASAAPAPVASSSIDPQLFTAPTPAPAPAPAPTPMTLEQAMLEDEDDNSDDDTSVENDEVPPLPAASTRSGTGRRPRKNAAAAGGIAKRPSRSSTPASIVPSYVQFEDPKPVIPPALGKGGVASYLNGERIGSQEPDEWRPTPEEYKKLSSKEKRQLRNKISARNFRVRRKEYISTLESHIADRDQLISAIRSELSNTRSENSELRREIDALKRAIQEGRLSAEATGLPPPRPLTPDTTPVASTPTRRAKDISRPNTRKDVGSNNSGRGFWGGAINGGVTSVHATLVPEIFPAAQQLSDKRIPSASPPSSASPATPPSEGVNMNPLMNLSPLFSSAKLPGSPAANVGLDIMGDAFNQRTLDGFRAQLWGRMAKEAGAKSVERERAAAMEGVETSTTPIDSSASESTSSTSSGSSASSGSPQQTMSSAVSPQPTSSSSPSTPPQATVSSSPSLSMLNSPAGIRSLWDSTLSSPQPTHTPSLFQASIFGAGFGTGKPVQNTFSQQNASSAQARSMLQAQWLALQQSRQLAAATPNAMSEVQAQAAQRQQQAPTPGQREAYLAQFAQAVASQQAQQQAQQAQLSGMAKEVRPAFFTREATKSAPAAVEKKSGVAEKLKPTTSTPEKKGATPQQAALFATVASQTLLGRMGSAFWDAFSGTGGKTDADKVRKVLEGKAVVRVVDVEKEKDLDSLEERMKKLSVAPTPTPCAGCASSGLGLFSNLRGKE
ncbi:bZIP transcription factor [Ceratobasidium sp. AG-Ba]|nr:bZIP transcription factor [Ceratobasidium sp. AG-Ba]